MNPQDLIKKLTASFTRWLFALLIGGLVVSKWIPEWLVQFVQQHDAAIITAVAGALSTLAWSAWSWIKAKLKIDFALQSDPETTTPGDVKAAVSSLTKGEAVKAAFTDSASA